MTTTKGNVGSALSDLVQKVGEQAGSPDESSGLPDIDPTLLDRAKGISQDAGATIDPCLVYARMGKEAFEQGLPLPNQKDSEFTSSQYNCFYGGYVKARMESGQANDNTLLIGGLALGGLVILGLVASKKGWI